MHTWYTLLKAENMTSYTYRIQKIILYKICIFKLIHLSVVCIIIQPFIFHHQHSCYHSCHESSWEVLKEHQQCLDDHLLSFRC